MRDVAKVCTFQSSNYKVIYRCEDDPRKQQTVNITQVVHTGQPEWHVDFWNMIVESWEDADNLIYQLSCLVRDVSGGVENGTL